MTIYCLEQVPTDILRKEIVRREELERIAREKELESKQVQVRCPRCSGKGNMKVYDQWSGCEVDAICHMCDGDKTIIAFRE